MKLLPKARTADIVIQYASVMKLYRRIAAPRPALNLLSETTLKSRKGCLLQSGFSSTGGLHPFPINLTINFRHLILEKNFKFALSGNLS